ncbi:MAG: hypothetical protein Kow00124_07210 [Anaerolineae bacterium]
MVAQTVSALRRHPWAAALVLLYLVFGVIYSVANPIHEATDELRHYRYVRYIADLHQLPVQSGEQGNAQAHHPPLYYATAALASFWVHPSDPLYEPAPNPHWSFRNWEIGTDNKNLYLHGPDEAWPYRDAALAAHVSRWVTLLWGAAAVALTYAIGLMVFPGRQGLAALAAALVAFNPMFLYLGAAINNDVPAGLAGAALTALCLLAARDGLTDRRAAWLGVAYGLTLLVKFNLVAMLAVIELALLLAPLASSEVPGRRERLRRLIRANAIILAIAAVIAGWWYVRNAVLYGEPTGFIRLTEIWGFRDPDVGLALIGPELRYAWTSLWGRFGYGQIPMHAGLYIATAVFCGLGLVGLIAWLVRARREGRPAPQLRLLAVLGAAALINFLVLLAYITVSPAGAMGRFLFPGLPAFAVLVAAGFAVWLPPRWEAAAAVAGMILVALPIAALILYLIPAYAIPAEAAPPPDPLAITLGDHVRILDYHLSREELLPGDQIDVTVTWQVIRPTDVPYAVFIHMINPQGVIVAQRDTYTGLGNYPSHWWHPGHIFTETYRVFVPETAYAPEETYIQIGLYNPDRGRLPVSGVDAPDSALRLGEVAIRSDPDAAYPNQLYVNFSGHFALLGYTIEPRALAAGETSTVTLYWQALDPPDDEDQMVFTQVLEGWNALAGADGPPQVEVPSTRAWEPGAVYVDRRELRLPPDIAPGIYEVWVGWYGGAGGPRLHIIAEDGRILDDYLVLGNIRVLPAD